MSLPDTILFATFPDGTLRVFPEGQIPDEVPTESAWYQRFGTQPTRVAEASGPRQPSSPDSSLESVVDMARMEGRAVGEILIALAVAVDTANHTLTTDRYTRPTVGQLLDIALGLWRDIAENAISDDTETPAAVAHREAQRGFATIHDINRVEDDDGDET